jgi:hypothetical protein
VPGEQQVPEARIETSLDAPADRREVQSGRDSSRVAQSEEQGALCVALSDPQLQRLRRGRPVCGRRKAKFDVVADEGHESLHLLARSLATLAEARSRLLD